MSSPTNINFDDLLPLPKPDAFNVEWQATAPVPDPNSPGNVLRELSGCYRVPPIGGAFIVADDYDVSITDSGNFLICNAASPFTLTLPAVIPAFTYAAQGVWWVIIRNLGAGAVTLDPNGQNLDGSASTITINQGDAYVISTDNTDYYSGVVSLASGGGGGFTNPMTTLGDIIYEDATPAAARLAGNTTSTRKFLRQTGTGSVSAAPAWDTLVAGDVPNLDASKITTGQLALARGGTGVDLSASGGTTKILAQDGSHVISARDLVAADIPNIAESQVTSLVSDLALKAPLASPALTGTPTAPTAAGGTSTTQIATTAFVQAAIPASALVIGFVVNNGAVGTNVGPELLAPRAGSVTKCVIVVKSSDGTTGLTFRIKKNGTDVFSSDPSVAAGTSAGTVSSTTSLTSNPLSVAANDVFTIDITSGSPNWAFSAQLET